MMESGRAIGKPRKPLSFNAASVMSLSDPLAQRRKCGHRDRSLVPTPSHPQLASWYRGRDLTSACEALP